jgi:Flp pilus assembly pilin Flp
VLRKLKKDFFKDERGEDFIEYGLLASLVAIALILILGDLADALNNVFKTVIETLNDVIS